MAGRIVRIEHPPRLEMNDGAVGAVNSPPRQLPTTFEPLPLCQWQCHVWCLHNSVRIAICVYLELHDGDLGHETKKKKKIGGPRVGGLSEATRERLARAGAWGE